MNTNTASPITTRPALFEVGDYVDVTVRGKLTHNGDLQVAISLDPQGLGTHVLPRRAVVAIAKAPRAFRRGDVVSYPGYFPGYGVVSRNQPHLDDYVEVEFLSVTGSPEHCTPRADRLCLR